MWVSDFKALSPPPDVVEANSDGIDVDACQRVLIEDSYFSVSSTARKDGCNETALAGLPTPKVLCFQVNDDVVCLKSGVDWWGRTYGRPTRDVLVRNLTVSPALSFGRAKSFKSGQKPR